MAIGGCLLVPSSACRLSFDFDDGTFTDTIDTLTDTSVSTADADADADADATADTTADTTATADPTTGDPMPPACGFDGFAGAALSWSRTVEVDGLDLAAVRDVAIDPLGDVVVLLEGSAAGDALDLVLAKYTVDGTLAWSVVFDSGFDLDDRAWGLALDGHADIYAAGSETTSELASPWGTTTDVRATVLKITSAGVPAWRYEHEAPAPPQHGANGRAAAIAASGSAIAMMLGPTANGSASTEVIVLDRFGDLSFSFARPELGDPLGIEITASGDLLIAGAGDGSNGEWVAYVAVDGTEIWRRTNASTESWRRLARAAGDEVLVSIDDDVPASVTSVRRWSNDGIPLGLGSEVVASFVEAGVSTGLAADCAGGVFVSGLEWDEGDSQGVLARRDGAGATWSIGLDSADITGPPTALAVHDAGAIALGGGSGSPWVARYGLL